MMSQLERLYMSVYNISQELNKRGTIASYRYKELEDRLAIAYTKLVRQPRAKIP